MHNIPFDIHLGYKFYYEYSLELKKLNKFPKDTELFNFNLLYRTIIYNFNIYNDNDLIKDDRRKA